MSGTHDDSCEFPPRQAGADILQGGIALQDQRPYWKVRDHSNIDQELRNPVGRSRPILWTLTLIDRRQDIAKQHQSSAIWFQLIGTIEFAAPTSQRRWMIAE